MNTQNIHLLHILVSAPLVSSAQAISFGGMDAED